MAFASVGTLGTVQNKTSQTSTSLTTSASASAGDLVVLVIAKDNVSTTDGETSEVSSVTDSGGNTWTKAKEYTNGEGAAAEGSTVSVWYSRLTTGISSGGTITANYGSATVAKALSAWKFTVGASVSVVASVTGAADATSTAGSLSLSGLTSKEYLFFRGSSREGAGTSDSFTATSGFTKISWAGNTGGASATNNIKVQGEFKIATSTGETSNPTDTQTGDWASVFFALQEFTGYTLNLEPASFTLTGSAATLLAGYVLNASPASFALTGADASLLAARQLNLEPTSYAITGADVSFAFGYGMNLEPASFTLTGSDMSLLAERQLNLEPTSFSITGADVSLLAGYLLNLEPTSYSLSASSVTFYVNGYLAQDPASGAWAGQSAASGSWATAASASGSWTQPGTASGTWTLKPPASGSWT